MNGITKDSTRRYNEMVELSKELNKAYDHNYDNRHMTKLEIELQSGKKDKKDGIEYNARRKS